MRNRDRWVIDASVALKWYLRDEDLLRQADRLHDAVRNDSALGVAPHIVRYEVANGLSVAVRMGRLPAERVPQDLQSFFNTRLANEGDPDWLLHEGSRIAMQYPVFLNDAIYLSLARALSVEFVTADRTLYGNIAGDFPFVRWLGDIPIS